MCVPVGTPLGPAEDPDHVRPKTILSKIFDLVARPFTKSGSSSASQPAAEASQSESQPASQPMPPPADDRFYFLSTFDTVFLIDDSGSMTQFANKSLGSGPTRWDQVKQAIRDIAPKCTQYDSDGIDIHFLNQKEPFEGVTDAKRVTDIFNFVKPRGSTPTGKRIHDILHPYVEKCEAAFKLKQSNENAPKPLNLIVITDGEPSDDVEAALIDIGERLDKIEADSHQVGVQFVQVGDEPRASESLRILDDDMVKNHGCRDFVDTQRFIEGEGQEFKDDLVWKTVLGAVNRRIDKKEIGNGA